MITLVTGGIRSGKSEYAESLLKDKNDTVYIATAEITDKEMQERIQKHIARRNPVWRTYEGFRNLQKAIGTEKNYLLDCVTNLVSGILFEKTGTKQDFNSDDVQAVIDDVMNELNVLICQVKQTDGNLIIVTNEVGSSIVPMNKISRAFADIQGIVNSKLAKIVDNAVLMACGIPIQLKGGTRN